MKKFILAILCFLSSPLWAGEPVQHARLNAAVVGAGVSAAVAAPTYVNSNSAYAAGPVTLTGVTAGNLLVALVSGNSSVSTTSLSGSCNVSWVALTAATNGSNDGARMFYCNNAANGNASITITNPPTDIGWTVHEYTPGTLDTNAETAVSDANENPTTGNISTSVATILVGFLADESGGAAPTATGWTSRTAQASHAHWTYDKAGTAGNQAFNPTRASIARTLLGIAAFKGN